MSAVLRVGPLMLLMLTAGLAGCTTSPEGSATIGAWRVGDEATYVGGQGLDGELGGVPEWQLAVRAPVDVVGPDGAIWQAPVIEANYPFRIPIAGYDLDVDRHYRHILDGQHVVMGVQAANDDTGAFLVQHELAVVFHQYDGVHWELPCGFDHDAAGRLLGIGDTVHVAGCFGGDYPFQVTSVAPLIVRGVDQNTTWTITYDDAPFPLETTMEIALENNTFTAVRERQSLVRGAGPLPPTRSGEPPAVPVLEFAPADAMGPTMDLDVIFPYSEALQALAQSDHPHIAGMLAGDWWMVRAILNTHPGDGEQEAIWWLRLGNATWTVDATVTAEYIGSETPAGPIWQQRSVEAKRGLNTYPAIPRSNLPDRAPTLSSVAASWAARTGDERPANVLGFELQCLDLGCNSYRDWIVAGHMAPWDDAEPISLVLDGSSAQEYESYFGVDRDGRPMAQVSKVSEATPSVG